MTGAVIGQSDCRPFLCRRDEYIAVGCEDEKEANRMLVWCWRLCIDVRPVDYSEEGLLLGPGIAKFSSTR